jgi:hypothetical protein
MPKGCRQDVGSKLKYTQLPFSIGEKGTQNILAFTALHTKSNPLERLAEGRDKKCKSRHRIPRRSVAFIGNFYSISV